MDLALLAETCARLGEPAYRAGQVWRWAAQGAGGFEQMTDLPRALRAQLERDVPFSTLTLEREVRAARRDRQGAAADPRRAAGRGRADALPGRAPLAVPLLAVGLPADVHVLRDRPDALRPQPDGLGDPRPGAALPPRRDPAFRASTTPCSWAWASR